MTTKVFLRAFEQNDYLLINKWRNNRKLQELTAATFYHISSETDKAWVIEKMKFSQKEFYFSICLKENAQMIGYCSLNDVDLIHRRCNWGGIVIGEKIEGGKNNAFEAAFLLMEYAFMELNLNRVTGYWLEGHQASLKLADRLNFQQEGMLRQSVFKNGRWYNQLLLSLLKEDFENLIKRLDSEPHQ
jgi:RimJ/RimL family protein N-acetyltransferase